MKHLLFLFLFLKLTLSYSNDTLTRAEIYNFSIGDTFDYLKHSSQTISGGPNSGTTSAISFSRLVISDLYSSIDSLTRYIIRKRLFPGPVALDTLVIGNLYSQEIKQFTYNRMWGDTAITDSFQNICGRNTNYVHYFCCGPGWENILFAKGLGAISDFRYGGALGNSWGDSLALIYYSGVHGICGQPFNSFPTAIERIIDSDHSVHVFHAFNSGLITIDFTPDINEQPDFALYDLMGREVKHFSLTDARNTVNVKGLGSGIYAWVLMNHGKQISKGKILID